MPVEHPFFMITLGLLTIISSLSVYYTALKVKNETIKAFSLFFLFLAFHSFFLALPQIIFGDDSLAIQVGRIIAVVFLFLMWLSGIKVLQLYKDKLPVSSQLIRTSLFTAASIYVFFQLYELFSGERIIDNVNIWQESIILGWLIGVTALLYGLLWSYVFYQNYLRTDRVMSKAKMLILSLDGIFMSLPALLSSATTNESINLLAFWLFFGFGTITAIVLVLDKALKVIKNTKTVTQNKES